MASIIGQTRKDGTEVFRVTVSKGSGATAFRETKTFPTRKMAEAWGKKRDSELEENAAAGKPITKTSNASKTLGDAIDQYTKDSLKAIGRTKAQVLKTIRKEYKISEMRCDTITSKELVAFAKELHDRPGLSSAATVQNYMSHLQAVFDIAQDAWGLPLNSAEMVSAMKTCKRLGYTAKAKNRTRRPTLDELDSLLTHFKSITDRRPNSVPMVKVVAFAIFSTRRQEEICRITWEDYEPENKRVMVRDMKHPGDKIGNDVWVNLPDPCCAIIDSMPKVSPRIFPYSTDAVSASMTRACKFLGIEDLHFHDMRHEGISRLFEMGDTVPIAAKTSGHRSWTSLQGYTHIIAKGDKYENWKWITEATKKPTAYINQKKR